MKFDFNQYKDIFFELRKNLNYLSFFYFNNIFYLYEKYIFKYIQFNIGF